MSINMWKKGVTWWVGSCSGTRVCGSEKVIGQVNEKGVSIETDETLLDLPLQ